MIPRPQPTSRSDRQLTGISFSMCGNGPCVQVTSGTPVFKPTSAVKLISANPLIAFIDFTHNQRNCSNGTLSAKFCKWNQNQGSEQVDHRGSYSYIRRSGVPIDWN